MDYKYQLHSAIKASPEGRQIAVAKKARIDPTKLSKILNGWREPSDDEKLRLAIVLNREVEEIFK